MMSDLLGPDCASANRETIIPDTSGEARNNPLVMPADAKIFSKSLRLLSKMFLYRFFIIWTF